jgi:acyl carrier protein
MSFPLPHRQDDIAGAWIRSRDRFVVGGSVESILDGIAELVYRSVDEVNEELENEVKLEKAMDTLLYGRGATIDSMTLVSLIVAVEDALRREYGLSVTLANEKAMSMGRSPFKTLGSMIGYVTEIVREAEEP